MSTETYALVSVKIATALPNSTTTSGPNHGSKAPRKERDNVWLLCFARGRGSGEWADLKIVDLLGDGLQLELASLELLGSLLVLSLPAVPLSFDGGDLAFVVLSLDIGKS